MKNNLSHGLLAYRTRRAGYTLIELTLVLGVVSVILGGVWQAYSAVSFKNQINQTVQNILKVVTKDR